MTQQKPFTLPELMSMYSLNDQIYSRGEAFMDSLDAMGKIVYMSNGDPSHIKLVKKIIGQLTNQAQSHNKNILSIVKQNEAMTAARKSIMKDAVEISQKESGDETEAQDS